MKNSAFIAATMVIAACSNVAFAAEDSDTAITLYNNGLGLVKTQRTIDLNKGINYLRWEDVAKKIDPTTVSLRSISAPNSITVKEQSYKYDVLSPQTILSKSVGKQIKLKGGLTSGSSEVFSGTLLSAQGYPFVVLKTDNGILLNPAVQVELAELPSGLVSKPSLMLKLESQQAGKQDIELMYQTSGMNWSCAYNAVVDKDDTKTDLGGWISLDNQSGASYKDIDLKLISGEVHTVQHRRPMPMMMGLAAASASPVAMSPQFNQSSFSEYDLYSFSGKTDIEDKETKQLGLFNASSIPTKKSYVFDADSPYCGTTGDADFRKVKAMLELTNSTSNNLGISMPAGKVRVYKRDKDDSLQFIGEDEIGQTSKDEKVRLYIGNASDILAQRNQTSVQQAGSKTQRISYQVSLHNHRDTDVTVTDIEHAWGTWKIVSSSMPYTKKDSRTFEFNASVPANGQTVISYIIEQSM